MRALCSWPNYLPKIHLQIPSYYTFNIWFWGKHIQSIANEEKNSVAFSKHSTYLIKAWLPGFLMSKGLESLVTEPEVRQWEINEISHLVLRFLSVIGWCIDGPLIDFSHSNSTNQKICGKLAKILVLDCLSVVMFNAVIFFFLWGQQYKCIYFIPWKKQTTLVLWFLNMLYML